MIYYENGNGDVVKLIDENSVELDIMEDMYPTGAIYLSLSDTNPNILFGGTWKRIEKEFFMQTGCLLSDSREDNSLLRLDYLPRRNYLYSLFFNNKDTDFHLLPFMDIYIWKKFS